MVSLDLPEPRSIPAAALEALQADYNLPICAACGTQYPSPRDECESTWILLETRCRGLTAGLICNDPRQFVPDAGQSWTSLAQLSGDRKNRLLVDKEDRRVTFIQTEPGFGINQTRELTQPTLS